MPPITKKKKSSSSSSSSDYYYVEEIVDRPNLNAIWADPTVRTVKPVQQKAKVSAKKKSECKCRCIIGWLLALLFLILFIVYLTNYNNSVDEFDAITATTSTTLGVFVGGQDWPTLDAGLYAVDDFEREAFIEGILTELTVEEKVAQMIQPVLNWSDSSELSSAGSTMKFGPGDLASVPVGSMISGGGAWPTKSLSYHGGNNEVFPCPGCNGHKSDVRAYTRLLEEFHMANESYWTARSATLGKPIRVPWMFAADTVHGHNNVRGATLFPHNVGLGAANNPELMQKIGRVVATEVASCGMDMTFSPSVSVPRFETWGRTYEGYSEDSRIVYDYSGAIVKGIQGTPQELMTSNRVVSNIKHWLGDGGTNYGMDKGVNQYSEEDLIAIHGAGYFSGLNEGAQVVMASMSMWSDTTNYDPLPLNGNDYKGKILGSKYLIQDVLKDKMRFDGIVTSDFLGPHTILCTGDECHMPVIAGVDLLMLPVGTSWKNYMANIVKGVTDEKIPLDRIDDAVRRILRVKYRAGLFDNDSPLGVACHAPDSVTKECSPNSCVFDSLDATGYTDGWAVDVSPDALACGRSTVLGEEVISLGHGSHMSIARQAVRESLVLLKNSNSALPIPKHDSIRVGVAGSASKDWSKVNGGWTLSWQGGLNDGVDVSLDPAVNDFPNGHHPTEAIREVLMHNSASELLEGCDAVDLDYCIIMIGESPYAEGVGDVAKTHNMEFKSLHAEYALDSQLVADVRAIADLTNMKVITLFFSGRALYVNEELNQSDAFVVTWLPGSAGEGITDVLFGDYDFEGTLPRTWPTEKCQWNVNSKPSFVNEDWTPPHMERSYDDINVFEGEQFPFMIGYGLKYDGEAPEWTDLMLDDRNYGCMVEDPAKLGKPTSIIDAMDPTNTGPMCSVYQSQFFTSTQLPCHCFSTDPFYVMPAGCPFDEEHILLATRGSIEFKQSTKNPRMAGQVYSKTQQSHINAAALFYDTNSTMAFSVTKTTDLTSTSSFKPALGLGMAFGDSSASLESSDRTMLDIGLVYDKLTIGASSTICIPLSCFNGSGFARNWFQLTQPAIIETRGTTELTLDGIQYFSDTVPNTGNACTHTVTVACEDTTLYPSYSTWVNRKDYAITRLMEKEGHLAIAK